MKVEKTPLSPPPQDDVSVEDRLRRIERLTHLMDNSLTVPGTNYRVGWDAVVGLIPGVGDLATAGVSAYIVYQATQLGISKWLIARMLGNVGIDLLAGSVPIVGDLFDASFKSNVRNARLLRRHLEKRK